MSQVIDAPAATTVSQPQNNGGMVQTSPPARQITPVHDDGPLAHLIDTAKFAQMQRIAETMAACAFMPLHLVCYKEGSQWKPLSRAEQIANCFLVVNQAMRWGADPFAIAGETYVVSGKLGYQGKLVAAIVNARSNIKGRLRCKYEGTGNNLKATVIGCFKDEDEDRDITLSVAQARTDHQMWTKDPEQKLWYSAVTKWARRHCPEVLLGVLTDDDVDRIVTGQEPLPETGINVDSKADMLRMRLESRLSESACTDSGKSSTTTPEPSEHSGVGTPNTLQSLTALVGSAKRISDIHVIEADGKKCLTNDEFEMLKVATELRKQEINANRSGG